MYLKRLTLFFIFFSASAFSNWNYVNKVDDFTDEKVMFAAYNDSDHRIQLSHEGTSVWMFITRKKLGTFEPSGIIELRVDRNKTHIIDPAKAKLLSKLMKKSVFQWEPSTVGFLLWHGKEEEGCGYIGQLLNGKELRGRYQLNSMERDSFKISLDGAKPAIIEGLGLTSCGS